MVGIGHATLRFCTGLIQRGRRYDRIGHLQGETGNDSVNDSSVLFWAAATGQTRTLANLRDEHDPREAVEGSVLISVVMNGQEEAALLKLEDQSTKLDATDAFGATALHHACRRRLRTVVEILLSKKSVSEHNGSRGETTI